MKLFKSKIEKTFNELFKKNLITKDMVVEDFDLFFDKISEKFQEINANIILDKFNCAKGISFDIISNLFKNNSPLKFDSQSGENANVIELNISNFNFPWSYGFTKKQNFSFVVYFNREDIISSNDKKIEKNYSKGFLETLAAASPQKAEEYLSNNVLRINGFLNNLDIKAIGFRYRDYENKLRTSFYLLSS